MLHLDSSTLYREYSRRESDALYFVKPPLVHMTGKRKTPSTQKAEWTFLTNHTHVLICVHEDLSIRTRDMAARVGITERAVQRIISDLCEAGYLTRTREGRRNRYAVHSEKTLRHPVEAHCLLSGLLKTVENGDVA